MNKTGQIVFITFIITYILFWGTVIYFGIPKEQWKQQKGRYDERQQIEQGRGCKWAYIALICYLVGYVFLDLVFEVKWCEPEFGILLGIALSVTVLLAYLVFQDAYFAFNEKKTGTLISVNCVGLCQLLLGIEHIADGDIIQNGIITDNALNLVFCGVVLSLDIFFLIRKQLDKKSA